MTFLKRRVGRRSKTVGKRMPVEENKFTKEEFFSFLSVLFMVLSPVSASRDRINKAYSNRRKDSTFLMFLFMKTSIKRSLHVISLTSVVDTANYVR
jgi:hypothetical protein